MHRLEDLRTDWQVSCEPLVNDCVTGVAPKLSALLANSTDRPTAEHCSEMAALADQAVRQWAEKRLLPHCLDWLHQGKHWANAEADGSFVRAEMAAALQHIPPFRPQLPEPTPAVPVQSWAIAAGVGALAGMIPGALLSWALTERREAGLVLGGVAGAVGLVVTVGMVARSSAVRTALTYVLSVSAAGTLLGGLRAYWRQQPTAGWLRGGFGLLAAAFVVLLARPRLTYPAPDAVRKQLREDLRAHLWHAADLVLAWCWAHPQRQPQKTKPDKVEGPEPLPGSVCRSLGDLYARVAATDGAADGLQDTVEVLLQRLEDAGYEWKVVPPGTPYDEAMKKDFETFARIEPGQPVRTRRPALHRNDRLLHKGELQRA
jgi:hypothetical protein